MLATTLLCLIVGISDGDTLTARCGQPGAYEQVKIRLSAIDAPESKQPFGQRSKQNLSDLCFQVEAQITPRTTDRYGRTVADVSCRGLDAAQHQGPPAWPGTTSNTAAAMRASARSKQLRAIQNWACGVIPTQSRHGSGALHRGCSVKHACRRQFEQRLGIPESASQPPVNVLHLDRYHAALVLLICR